MKPNISLTILPNNHDIHAQAVLNHLLSFNVLKLEELFNKSEYKFKPTKISIIARTHKLAKGNVIITLKLLINSISFETYFIHDDAQESLFNKCFNFKGTLESDKICLGDASFI